MLLDVDGDHDDLPFTHRNAIDAEESLGQAIEALVTCRHALRRIQTA